MFLDGFIRLAEVLFLSFLCQFFFPLFILQYVFFKMETFHFLQDLVSGSYLDMDTDGRKANVLKYECLLFGMLIQILKPVITLIYLLGF